ncbi:MAG: class I SAM-dependent methyltransferase [Minisyncoccota bacterium]
MSEEIIRTDIGCGKNKKSGFTGVDINPDSDADIIASALDLPLEEGSVDEVCSQHLVEHFTPEEAQQFFDEIYRVLKKGGKASLKVDRDWSKRVLLKKDPTHKYRFTEQEIKDLVAKFSEKEVKNEIYFLNFYSPRNKIFVKLIK